MSAPNSLEVLRGWRERLASLQDDAYWRELQNASHDDGLRAAMREVLPELASFWTDRIDRRRMLQLLGASLALVASGCSRSKHERLAPYAVMPEGVVPGVPQLWATALTR